MDKKVIIGGYTINGIEMLDDDTCCLYFEEINEDDMIVEIVAERWLDEDSWSFMDNYFQKNGYFINAEKTTHLSESEKEECKTFINSWLEDLSK